MMGRLSAGVYLLILTLGVAAAQTANVERALPQWLTGIIAVAAFLFFIFVALLVNKAWCETSNVSSVDSVKSEDPPMMRGATYDNPQELARNVGAECAYENLALDGIDDKVTAM